MPLVILMVMGITMGGSFLAFTQVRSSGLIAMEGRDTSRALNNATSCANAAVKSLPGMLNAIMILVELDPESNASTVFASQLDENLFGDSPYGHQQGLIPWCEATLTKITDQLPPPGWDPNAGCFKEVHMRVAGQLLEAADDNQDVTQTMTLTERTLIVRALFGPVLCD